MSLKTLLWMLVAATALGAVLLFNYWASFQPLSTLIYAGFVLALFGLANSVVPFRFLGIRRRAPGAFVLTAGVALSLAGLLWPAPTVRVARGATLLDTVMPEYQFSERHSARVHANPERVLQAVRQSTFRDMTSLTTLLKVRGAALRHDDSSAFLQWQDKPILDSFVASGYVLGGGAREIVACGGANLEAGAPLKARTVQEFAAYREPRTVKIAFGFDVKDAGGGWSSITAETRVVATDAASRGGMTRYWRLIVPGSGLLRRQWLDGIKRRAESTP
jgi:hypothetical protein